MNATTINIGAVAVIVIGYFWALFADNKRLEDFQASIEKIGEARYRELLAEIRAVQTELRSTREILEARIDRLASPLIRP